MLTAEENARLLDLRFRIRRGDYDSDRTPDSWRYRLSVSLKANGAALIIYFLALGLALAMLVLALLIAFGG